MIDLHCHILPGLDDGAKDLEEALEMARIAQKDGIEKIVATPHLFREDYRYEDFGKVRDKLERLNRLLRKNKIDVEILLGAEVHISHDLVEKVRKNREMLVLNGSSYMFVEFPSDHIFRDVKNLFFELMSEGIIPIIAHPERNSVFTHNPSILFDLIQMGALAQGNSGSFHGLYGDHARESLANFLAWNLIHFIASDGHNTRLVSPRLSEALKTAVSLIGEAKAKALVRDNPKAVLDDRELPYLDNPVDPKSMEKTFKIKIPSLFRKKGNSGLTKKT